jgi:hypothetical protein
MVISKDLSKEAIKKKGYWNYTELYNFTFNWLKDNGYSVKEKEYTEKLSDAGKEIVIQWEAGRKYTEYFKSVIKVKWHILTMQKAEIERDGKVEKTNKGEVKLACEGALEKDYEDKWADKPLNKLLRGVYDRYIMRTTNETYEDKVKADFKEFVAQTKGFLEI